MRDQSLVWFFLRRYKVVSQMDQFTLVKSKLAESSIHVDEENSGLELTPLAHIEVSEIYVYICLRAHCKGRSASRSALLGLAWQTVAKHQVYWGAADQLIHPL